MTEFNIWKWVFFNAFVLVMIALDLGVFSRKSKVVTVKAALGWSGVWVGIALLYNAFVYYQFGARAALEFLTGYLIEKSLSIDNIFVFVLIFSFFKIPEHYQRRVLSWGIIGALIMRAILIAVGAALIENFAWVIYVFGAFLIITGIRMALQKEHGIDPERNPAVRAAKKLFAVTPDYHGEKFFVILDGIRHATPLFVVLLIIEFTDLIFAVDSIPAIFAVTTDPFIVYTSNVFAILGLRSLYFALAGIIHKFHYLKLGLSVVLIFVGAKMLLAHTAWKIPIGWALGGVLVILLLSVLASLLKPAAAQTKH